MDRIRTSDCRAPSCRPVAGLHLPEKLLVILPYAPAYIGIVPALIELFLFREQSYGYGFMLLKG